jgi:DNA-binding CsgD family transcriptional regulator
MDVGSHGWGAEAESLNGESPETRSIVGLTVREEEVLRRTSVGETNAQVAVALGVTVHAVKFHLASIFRKLDVHNRTEAAAVYLQYAARRAQ